MSITWENRKQRQHSNFPLRCVQQTAEGSSIKFVLTLFLKLKQTAPVEPVEFATARRGTRTSDAQDIAISVYLRRIAWQKTYHLQTWGQNINYIGTSERDGHTIILKSVYNSSVQSQEVAHVHLAQRFPARANRWLHVCILVSNK